MSKSSLSDTFDLVVRNGIVATASDTIRCDIGVSGGRITALAENLPKAVRETDAAWHTCFEALMKQATA